MLPVGGYSVSSTHAVPSDRRPVTPKKENCERIKFERDMEQDLVELKNQYELWIGDISCTYNSYALVKDSDVPSDAFDYYREAVNKIASRIIARLEERLSSSLYDIRESKLLAYSSYLINKIFLNYPSDDQLIKKLFELNSRYSHNLYALLQHLESFLNGLHPVFLKAEGCFDKEQISNIILQLKRGLPLIVMLGGMHKMQPQMRVAIKLYLNIINYLLNNVQLLGDLKSINTLTDIYNRFIEIRFSSLFDIGEHIYRVYDNRNVLRMLYSLSFLPEIYKKK